jgi:hypothetical protein
MAFLFDPPQELAESGASTQSSDNFDSILASSEHRLNSPVQLPELYSLLRNRVKRRVSGRNSGAKDLCRIPRKLDCRML